jgi:aminoglycoside phosphotransferase family enzyme
MKEGLLKFWLKQKDYRKMSVSTIKSILKTCSIEYERLNESRLGDRLTDQMQVVEALRKPEAYDEEVEQIELKQTHISYVFLTKNFVYKIKKAVDFGFLDFSTLEKRRFFCEKELDLNRRLCGDMYLEVVPITESADAVKINGEGTPVEYAVKMKRIPEENIMTRLLEEGKVDQKLVDRMAKIIAEFHKKAEADKRIGEFGSLPMIERNWRENFEQTEEFVGETVSPESYRLIQERIDEFMRRNVALFAKRVAENRIRECHGDIHSGNIFIADKIYIFDAIEFNERFRYCDVASEVAFLAMDLDFKERSDLSSFLVDRYVKYSGDRELELLLPFYKCYRAYVRGKVTSFKLNDPSIGSEEKSAATEEARAYFDLAANYAKHL